MMIVKNYPRMSRCVINTNPEGETVCRAGYGDEYDEKARCMHCGCASEQTLKGALSDLRGLTGHKIAYFERVACPNTIKVDKSKEIALDSHKLFYEEREGYVYRCVVTHNNKSQGGCGSNPNTCIVAREDNEEFDRDCRNRDLDNVHKAYKQFDEWQSSGNTDYYKEHICPPGSPIKSIYYHLYCCKEKGFTEVILPVFSSPERKSVLGMLVFGQIIVESEVSNLQEPWVKQPVADGRIKEYDTLIAETKSDNRFFQTVEDLFMRHSVSFSDFIARLHTCVEFTVRDYLYAMQTYLFDTYADDTGESGDPDEDPDENILSKKLIDMFIDIKKRFALKRCLLFLPDLINGKHPSEKKYGAMEIIEDDVTGNISAVEMHDITLDANIELRFNKQKVDIGELITSSCVDGFPFEDSDKSLLAFYGNNSANFFFGILLEWDAQYFNVNNATSITHDGFFASLVVLCRAKIAARIAWLKQMNIEYFTSSAIHDLGQKAYVMGLHNRSFEMDIKNARSLGVFEQEALRPANSNARTVFYRRCYTYNIQMKNSEQAIGYIQNSLEQEDLLETPNKSYFDPYIMFMANFNQQFNNPLFHSRAHKRLCITHPGTGIGNRLDPIFADPVMIERAVSNLLDNAFKFAYDYTNIYLDYAIDIDRHIFRVTNFGSGISEDVTKKLFRFRQRGGEGKSGQGLGLWTARRYARKHGGDLIIEEGIIGSNSKINPKWDYNAEIYTLCLQNGIKFEASEKSEVTRIKDILYTEVKKLKEDVNDKEVINPVARYMDLTTVYREMFSSDIKSLKNLDEEDKFYFNTLKYGYNQPTYATTFMLTIPVINQ